jgi:uncharacterized protein YoxC
MPDERLGRIEARLDVLSSDVAVLKTDVAVLKTDVAELKTDVGELKTDVAVLKTDVGEIKVSVAELGNQMLALHEDAMARLSTVAEGFVAWRELRNEVDGQRQRLDHHVVVGDAVDREHATRLDDHERRIRRLERR